MKLLVLGASGVTGSWLVPFAAQAGHQVTALIRPTSAFEAPTGARVVRGNVLDPDVLAASVEGQDAIASCLGLRRSSKNPWAPLLSPPNLMTQVTSLLVPTMVRAAVRRVVAMSAGGVAESITQLSTPVQWVVGAGNIGVAYRDLADMERQLSASRLDWLVVRPVTLVNGRPTGRAARVDRFGLFSIIRRADVATWMLGALSRPTPYVEHTVLIGTGRAGLGARP
jgi:uncharacterized protein YbjT (DUF2867 family)